MGVSTLVVHPLDCPGGCMQNWSCHILSGVLPMGPVTERQQAQKGWWMWLLPLLSLTSHPPLSISPPAHTPRIAVSIEVWSTPRHLWSHSTRAQAATDLSFCQKGPGCCLWVEIKLSPPLHLFAFCMDLQSPGFVFWFHIYSIKQWFSLRRVYLLITWKIQSKSQMVYNGI